MSDLKGSISNVFVFPRCLTTSELDSIPEFMKQEYMRLKSYNIQLELKILELTETIESMSGNEK